MASVAGYYAVYQLITKPHYWEKTHHGLHLATRKVKDEKVKVSIKIELFSEIFPRLKNFTGIRIINPIRKSVSYVQEGIKVRFINLIKIIQNSFISIRNLVNDSLPNFNLTFSLNNNGPVKLDKLKILIFNWRDTKHAWAGGAEVYIHELAKRWVKEGHEVTLFCGNDGKNPRSEVIDGVKVIRRGGFYLVYFWAFFYYLFGLRKSVDLVIDTENGVPFFTPLYARKPKFLLVHHVHQEVFRRHLNFPFSTIASFIESTLMPLVYKNQKVITISNSSKEDLARLGFTKKENIEVVIPGVNSKQYQPLTKTSYPSLVYLGRHKPYKNIDIAIKAFAQIIKSHPKARLVIAGEGESTDELIKLTSKLKIERQVDFVGKVSEKEKARLFAQSWVALQPSSFEGWGLTVIEANASGTPVIASGSQGLREAIVHGETGLLVNTGETKALVKAIDWFISYSSQRKVISSKALTWSKQFQWNISSSEFLRIVRNELAQRQIYVSLGESLAPSEIKTT
jgi:glycosyltransferase involved in cell wall biosynthesis